MIILTNEVLGKKKYFKSLAEAYAWLVEAYKVTPTSIEMENLINTGKVLTGTVHTISQK